MDADLDTQNRAIGKPVVIELPTAGESAKRLQNMPVHVEVQVQVHEVHH
jgi:hypothetical protein